MVTNKQKRKLRKKYDYLLVSAMLKTEELESALREIHSYLKEYSTGDVSLEVKLALVNNLINSIKQQCESVVPELGEEYQNG
ncbi:MAG: hypothetical protein CMD96_05905 [Gammaproteobacteria bacterium]|nr:hypothetical protein [Gammaproteobacteria bacterium]|tara:strand:+ start:3537 stop:3782 length:246 start_codon:yes stop_codon:yes gene_type:complete